MCGIFGYIGNSPKSFDNELLTLKHRGPDNNSSYSHQSYNKHIYLGHTRLSIVDLSANANQPMVSKEQEIVLIYNGEIYNHLELRKRFLKDEIFKSSSDTETILKLYKKFGVDFVNELNGDFALSIYDKRLEKIFLFRDRLGVKPLYYYKNENEFLFASEIKALLAGGIEPKISAQSLNEYFIYKYVPESNTLISNIYRLQPGHNITLDLKTFELAIKPYWHLKKKSEYSKMINTD